MKGDIVRLIYNHRIDFLLSKILVSTIEILEPNGDQELLCQLFDALSPLIAENRTIFEEYIATFVTKSLLIACKAPSMVHDIDYV